MGGLSGMPKRDVRAACSSEPSLCGAFPTPSSGRTQPSPGVFSVLIRPAHATRPPRTDGLSRACSRRAQNQLGLPDDRCGGVSVPAGGGALGATRETHLPVRGEGLVATSPGDRGVVEPADGADGSALM